MEAKDVFVRKKVEIFFIKPEVMELTKKDRVNLLDELFKSEYQGKLVTYKMLEDDLFAKTNAVTRRHFSIKGPHSSYKGHNAKIKIGASGDYIDLISNASYSHSDIEKKETQNNFHKNTLNWHYFRKIILCEDEYYQVTIDVHESKQHEFTVYNVSLMEIDKERLYEFFVEKSPETKEKELINSVPEDTDLMDKFSSDDIISKECLVVNKDTKDCKASLDDILNEARLKSEKQKSSLKEKGKETILEK